MLSSVYAVSFAAHGIKPDAAHENAGVVCAGWLVCGRVCSATKVGCVQLPSGPACL